MSPTPWTLVYLAPQSPLNRYPYPARKRLCRISIHRAGRKIGVAGVICADHTRRVGSISKVRTQLGTKKRSASHGCDRFPEIAAHGVWLADGYKFVSLVPNLGRNKIDVISQRIPNTLGSISAVDIASRPRGWCIR